VWAKREAVPGSSRNLLDRTDGVRTMMAPRKTTEESGSLHARPKVKKSLLYSCFHGIGLVKQRLQRMLAEPAELVLAGRAVVLERLDDEHELGIFELRGCLRPEGRRVVDQAGPCKVRMGINF
jgi:hypothetical protein